MTPSPIGPTLKFYRRDGCDPCDEARLALQQVLEDRVRRGEPIPRVRFVDVTTEADLEKTYGPRIPVLAIGDAELSLTVSYRSIATFLDRVLGRAA
ncbi:MAG: glutaredoxin family protein [Candidatus Limnocylindrales bacterium]